MLTYGYGMVDMVRWIWMGDKHLCKRIGIYGYG